MSTVEITKQYYNSPDADVFYHEVWGGDDIHIGLYTTTQDIREASRLTVERMASLIENRIDETSTVLDLGSGYGGAARYLNDRFHCRVICLNLSDVENQRNRNRNSETGQSEAISVIDGSFEEIPPVILDHSVDLVWSQDAMLHSGSKEKIFAGVSRVLKPGGRFIFTDPMQSEKADPDRLQPVYDRIHLKEMGSFDLYRRLAVQHGMTTERIFDLSPQLPVHYGRVLEELNSQDARLRAKISGEYIDRMKMGLQHWIDAGNRGDLAWGIIELSRNS